MDLVAFIRDRLDEDESAAVAIAAYYPPPWDVVDRGHSATVRADAPNYPDVMYVDDLVGRYHHPDGRPMWLGELVAHVGRHDPERVLRDVASKRAVVDEYDRAVAPGDDIQRDRGYTNGLRKALLLLAATWADHPDYPGGPPTGGPHPDC
jgi:hypothetical protein